MTRPLHIAMESPVKNMAPTTQGVAKVLLHPAFPVTALLVFFALASVLRHGLIQQDNTQIQANLENEANAIATSLEREFLTLVTATRRMAQRQQTSPDISEDTWREDARNYLRDMKIYHAIEWIDRDFIIRWLEPLSGNPNIIGYNVAFSEARRQALTAAMNSGLIDISGVINLAEGGKGLIIYAPIGAGAANNGFIASVFRMEELFQQLLNNRTLNDFRIEILDRGQLTYQLNSAVAAQTPFQNTVPVHLPGLDWSLRLYPSENWVRRQRSDWPAMTFASVLLMGLLTSLTILLAQQILKRNQALLKTRYELDQEISQREQVQKNLAHLETTDTLTGLANRRFFMEDLSHTLSIADRQMRQVALIMLDLDRFQTLNDSLGHQFGDEVLVKVAERLNRLSNEQVLVAYSGGDEFMLCQQKVDDIDDVIHLLGEIKQCFAEPFAIHRETINVTATLGVAVYPQSGLDADTLMRNADVAMYRAKEQGRNTYQFYTEGMQEREVRRLELDKDLSQALANDEFVLYYQPQIELDTSEIHSVEALIRWQHPQRGLLSPIEFIPLAEDSGRISDIGKWVVSAACRQLAQWQETDLGHLRIAVNLSGRELDDESLVDHIQATLHTEGLSADRLEVELTEEIFIQNIDHNLNQLSRLHELGVNLAIDDFGVGYSSLGYLRDFPVDLLKIDRSFITHVTEQHDDAVITRAVINLAHNLGLRVVAEGVETEAQMNFLKHHNCNMVQGYLVSRPVPPGELEAAFASGRLVTRSTENS